MSKREINKKIKNKESSQSSRHFGVVLEDINSKINLVVEGHQGLNRKIEVIDKKIDNVDEKLEDFKKEVDYKFEVVFEKFEKVDKRFEVVTDELRLIRHEVMSGVN